jgi:LysM repeat protein
MTGAAAPALLGVAAAAALGLQAGPASASTTHVAAHTTAHVAAVAHKAAASHKASVAHAQLTAYVSTASSSSYTVESGDTLSSIAANVLGNSGDWNAIYQANTSEISNPNVIYPGQVLTIPASGASTSETTEPTEATSTTTESAPTEQTSTSTDQYSTDSASSTSGDSSFQQCVINAESGGDSQVMNSSGHYGLYQFSASTWAAYGGNPADFGDASVAEQNQVFDNAIADGGESNWAPYDGC